MMIIFVPIAPTFILRPSGSSPGVLIIKVEIDSSLIYPFHGYNSFVVPPQAIG